MSLFNKLKTLKNAVVGRNFRTGDSTKQDFELDRDDQKVCLVYFDDGTKKT